MSRKRIKVHPRHVVKGTSNRNKFFLLTSTKQDYIKTILQTKTVKENA